MRHEVHQNLQEAIQNPSNIGEDSFDTAINKQNKMYKAIKMLENIDSLRTKIVLKAEKNAETDFLAKQLVHLKKFNILEDL